MDLGAPIVKVCGLQSVEAATRAIESGATLIGIICVPNRKRTVDPQIAKEISRLIHDQSFNKHGTRLVGVFRNQALQDVRRIAEEYNVDIVQLHGSETWRQFHEALQKPIIKRMIFPEDCQEVAELSQADGLEVWPLFDSEAGGTGEQLNWRDISSWSNTEGKGSKFILAGGLTPDNVEQALALSGVIGVDVSGGVETDGSKDLAKIDRFIARAKR